MGGKSLTGLSPLALTCPQSSNHHNTLLHIKYSFNEKVDVRVHFKITTSLSSKEFFDISRDDDVLAYVKWTMTKEFYVIDTNYILHCMVTLCFGLSTKLESLRSGQMKDIFFLQLYH